MLIPEFEVVDLIAKVSLGGNVDLVFDHGLVGTIVFPDVEGFGRMFQSEFG